MTYSLQILMKYLGESRLGFQFSDLPFKKPFEGVFNASAFISMMNFNHEGFEYFKTIFKIVNAISNSDHPRAISFASAESRQFHNNESSQPEAPSLTQLTCLRPLSLKKDDSDNGAFAFPKLARADRNQPGHDEGLALRRHDYDAMSIAVAAKLVEWYLLGGESRAERLA